MSAAVKSNHSTREHPIQVRFSREQRVAIEAAAKAAGVTLSYYLRESALIMAAEEGFVPANPPGWRPSLGKLIARINGDSPETAERRERSRRKRSPSP